MIAIARGNLEDATRLKIVGQSRQRQCLIVIESVCLFSISVKSSKVIYLSFNTRVLVGFNSKGIGCCSSAGSLQVSLMVDTNLSTSSQIEGFSFSSICCLLTKYGSSLSPDFSNYNSILQRRSPLKG